MLLLLPMALGLSQLVAEPSDAALLTAAAAVQPQPQGAAAAAPGDPLVVAAEPEAWQLLKHSCDATFDETGIRSWPTGFTIQIRVPHWKGGQFVKVKSNRPKFHMGQVWNAALTEQTEDMLTFRLNANAGGIVGDKEHDLEFGFMADITADKPFEKGDLEMARLLAGAKGGLDLLKAKADGAFSPLDLATREGHADVAAMLKSVIREHIQASLAANVDIAIDSIISKKGGILRSKEETLILDGFVKNKVKT